MEIHNFGRSPAWIVEIRLGLFVGDYEPNKLPIAEIIRREAEVLHTKPIEIHQNPVTEGKVGERTVMSLHGSVKIIDIFNDTRTIGFEYRADPNSRKLVRVSHDSG